MVEKVSPGRTLEDCRRSPGVRINYQIKTPKPKLQAVSNGARLMVVHSPTDLATHWQHAGSG